MTLDLTLEKSVAAGGRTNCSAPANEKVWGRGVVLSLSPASHCFSTSICLWLQLQAASWGPSAPGTAALRPVFQGKFGRKTTADACRRFRSLSRPPDTRIPPFNPEPCHQFFGSTPSKRPRRRAAPRRVPPRPRTLPPPPPPAPILTTRSARPPAG